MVDLREEDGFPVDVIALAFDNLVVLGLKLVGGMDTAGDWAVGMKLSLHLISTSDTVVVSHIVVCVVDGLAIGIGSLAFRRRSTVTANIIVRAHTVNQIIGSVLLT